MSTPPVPHDPPRSSPDHDGWNWSPAFGRWSMELHGLPVTPSQVSISTDGLSDAQSYEFWRTYAFTDFDPDARAAEPDLRFDAQAQGLVWNKAEFFSTQSSAVAGERRAALIRTDGIENVTLGLVLNGTRKAREQHDTDTVTQAGEFFVYDSAKPCAVHWSDHKALFFVVRRDSVSTPKSRAIPAASLIARQIGQSHLAPVLRDQFSLMARHGDRLQPAERAILLQQTRDLVTLAFQPPERAAVSDVPMAPLYRAAIRYIHAHMGNVRLDADRVARALGCSRATLYRAFAAHDAAVSETISEMRLLRARDLLLHAPLSASISDIAVQCGLLDTANFSRRFRRRFGLSPSEARREGQV